MPVIDLLRQRTEALHDHVERVVSLEQRCASLASYRALLAQLLGLYRPIERHLRSFDWSAAGLNLDERRKTELLSADLKALGFTPAQIARIPDCAAIPAPASLAGAVGCLYVLEGATLGGQVISRQVRRSLGVTPASGGSFHAAYGDKVGIMWRAFRDAANRYCSDESERCVQAVAGAIATFEAFGLWLSADAADDHGTMSAGAGRQ